MAGKEVRLAGLDSLPFEDLLQPQVVQACLYSTLELFESSVKEAQTVISSPSSSWAGSQVVPSLPLHASSFQLSFAFQALAIYEFAFAQTKVVDLSLSFLIASSISLRGLRFSFLLFILAYLSHAFYRILHQISLVALSCSFWRDQ